MPNLQPQYDTERTKPKFRVDKPTAALLHRLNNIGRGKRLIVIINIRDDGTRSWELAHVTETCE